MLTPINQALSQQAETPEVGGPATIIHWSDRDAATIVKITRTQIHVREDRATLVSGSTGSESQTYTYEPNPDAPVDVFRRTKGGRYRNSAGNYLRIGYRNTYRDPSF